MSKGQYSAEQVIVMLSGAAIYECKGLIHVETQKAGYL